MTFFSAVAVIPFGICIFTGCEKPKARFKNSPATSDLKPTPLLPILVEAFLVEVEIE
jgi:hypothetical protein